MSEAVPFSSAEEAWFWTMRAIEARRQRGRPLSTGSTKFWSTKESFAMADRCEPPEELRGQDGWHWVDADRPLICQWLCADEYQRDEMWKMPSANLYSPESAYRRGYRYLAPVTTPAEVERLRADLARLVEVVEWYANPEIYKPSALGPHFDVRDWSHVARAALAAIKERKA